MCVSQAIAAWNLLRSFSVRITRLIPSSAKTRPIRLRGLAVVELEQAAEPLTARDRTCAGQCCLGRDERVAQPLVRALFMKVRTNARTAARRCPSPSGTMRSKHSDLTDPTNRSANAFKFGLRAGRTSGFAPLSRSRRRKAAV